MEKKEFQLLVKEKLKSYGFSSRGNIHYKLIDADYLVRVELEHRSFYKAYSIDFCVVYEVEKEVPLYKQFWNWRNHFYFPEKIRENLSNFHLKKLDKSGDSCASIPELTVNFQYDRRSIEELDQYLDENIQKRLLPVFNKELPLELYRKFPTELVYSASLSTTILDKMIRLSALNYEKIYQMRERWMRGEQITDKDYESEITA